MAERLERDIRLLAEYSKSAADRSHPVGDLNCRRCLRLLVRWDLPDRSSQAIVQSPNDYLAWLFVDCLKDTEAVKSTSAELIASVERLEASLSTETKLQVQIAKWSTGSELGCGESSVVRLVRGPEGTFA
jgi:hypothetical protein